LAILVGLIGGGIIGCILGCIIGVFYIDRRTGVIIGIIIGLPIAASQFTGGDNTYIPASTGMFALGIIVFCGILGFFIASILSRRYPHGWTRDFPP
jgi:hypothetical protein